jgi:hypothetical protein
MWFQTLEKLKLALCKMPRDVSTRWNSTFDMLHFTLQYREAIDHIATNKGAGLHKYEMSEHEWHIAQQLCENLQVHVTSSLLKRALSYWLQVFKDATLFFSRSTPNLTMVIPAMDYIDEFLTTASLKTTLEPSVHAALRIGKKMLNCYYDKTDNSEVYRIAMGM